MVNFASNLTNLSTFWKISRTVLLILIALITSVWLLIQTTPVQNFLVRQVTNKLSSDLNTTVRIDHVNFALFNSMLLEGTLVQDQRKDTLLYAGRVSVNITDWFFFKDKIELEYIGLQDAVVHLNRTDSIWNYQFITDYFTAPANPNKKNNIDLNLSKVEFDNISVLQQDRWRGEDMRGAIKSLTVDAEAINFNKRLVNIRTLDLDDPFFAIYNYPGLRPPRKRTATSDSLVNDPAHLRWNPGEWSVHIHRLNVVNGGFRADIKTDRPIYPFFDGQHIFFSDVNGTFTDCRLNRDTITANVKLSTRERSGFEVKELAANMTAHPEAMVFNELSLRTNRSHLHDYFAMRYESFDDMSDFISAVRMEGRFDDAIVSSDDIAFFAPELKNWKKRIRINGSASGSVDNLRARNFVVEAGADTYVKGNISISGLPDIDKTYIDFEAENFRTTYKDALAFAPRLREVTQPRLDLLQYLRFRGNFTGFFNDFVTFGSLETRLGTIVTDLNMKLPDNGLASYSGNIRTNGFQIGQLLDNNALGKLVFEGRVDGSGISLATVNAKLDGNIRLLEFNQYPYQNIMVKGDVAKKLFNGELTAADPNLQAKLNGLVDFSKDVPQFNFEANISKADLLKLNLLKDQVDFYGKFRFNFTGSNIDNFEGTARIFDASLFRSGKRISFDSLYLESKRMDSSKVITAVSNEFDAALAGEFSIRELPAAFRTFLNKYYPAYIKPSKKELRNENFSFVVTTKNVDEYIRLIDTNLTGFNYSTLSGRIDTRDNLLDLNAEIPQFNYRNIAVYDLRMKATGTYDSLSMEAGIANVYLNDSLNFPGTSIRLRSANDISDINIRTSANQTLNSANLSAQVQTLPKGVKINFHESGFDINGKNWTIEKNGELVLTEDLVSAKGIKLFNGLQEITVSSAPPLAGRTGDVRIDLKSLNIADFSPYLVPSNRLEGLLNGRIQVTDPFGKLKVDLDAQTEQFRLDDDSIGRLALKGNYYHSLKEANFNAISDNRDYKFELQGVYKLADSSSKDNLDIFADLKDSRINILQRYLTGVFSDVTGLATGSIRITGPTDDLDYIGSINLSDAMLRVKYTNVLYTIPYANVELKRDRIDFGSFSFQDQRKNKGLLTRGILYHDGFNNLSFDFAMTTDKLTVLDTDNSKGDAFFGNVVARADMTFTGPLRNMEMNIEGEPTDSSSFFINNKSGKETGQADFVVWKVYGKEMEQAAEVSDNNLTVNLDVTANNYANMYVILDELTGDIIQATGHGNLKMRAATNGDFTITGRYDIERGNYNFNFESLLRKPFRLREGVGNYIQWTGDPYNANIKVDAEYEAENVRFSDLGNSLENFQASAGSAGAQLSSNNVSRFRGKVLVVAKLTGQLLEPDIEFEIELPANSPLKNDLYALSILNRIQTDQNELNKQVAFLVVFNSFGPLSTSSQASLATSAFEGIVVGSISGVLSNTLSRQFSSAFQKIFNDKSIKVNFNAQLYSGSNFIAEYRNPFSIDRTNINLSVGKSLFNERLTFTFGSAVDFGLTPAQASASSNLPFLPDITAEWKITPDGKLALTFFYRDSYNFVSSAGGRSTRSGASIGYRQDFENVGDLLKKKKDSTVRQKQEQSGETGRNSNGAEKQ